MTGAIKSYSPTHGYGFIQAGNEDVFFHITEWQGDSDPVAGEEVDFVPSETSKG